jgi:hypothetical protein
MNRLESSAHTLLVRKIGLGGFGVVWLAEKRTAITTTQFALKLPRGEDVDVAAFKQEAGIIWGGQ